MRAGAGRVVLGLLLCGTSLAAQERVPWNGSRVRGTPEDPPPFRVEREFPKHRFVSPVDLVPVPGTGLLAVAELSGRILTFDAERSNVLADLKGTLLGLAFHPAFTQNEFLYVFFAPANTPWVLIRRLTVRRGQNLSADPASAVDLLRWRFAGPLTHTGGGLRFGPDGMLYVGVGDGSPGGDERGTGQDLSDLESSILRIDVDSPSKDASYGIPRDNPFVGRAGARPEIWAFGVRQPWKMSFDPDRGDLWVGEVGQDLWESVLRVRAGENYGWSVREGGHPYRSERRAEPGPIASPVVTHPHSEFRALIGGLVYRGAAHAGLAGSYVYGDHETGRIWELRLDQGRIVRHRKLAASPLRIIAFAEDANRELHILSYGDGGLYRLTPNTGAARNVDFPRRLSETGLFESVPKHRPAPGVQPYEVASALWADGAAKERFLALPGSSRIRPDTIPNRYVTSEDAWTWDFPDGTVLVKTFSLGDRRVETRLLHLEKLDGSQDIRSQVWRGYTYRWNDEQSDADLVDAAGRDVETTYNDAGGRQRQVWHFPSRNQCLQCHGMSAHFVLGVTTMQLNRDIDAPGAGKINQLDWFTKQGLFETPLTRPPADLPRLVDVADETQPLELRARSYLHANCAHCHVYLGGGNSEFRIHAATPLPQAGLVDAAPTHGTLGLPDARLLAPGSPERSLILHRMGVSGEGRMPPLASSVVDAQGMDLLARWIRRVPPVSGTPWVAWSLASMMIVLLAGLRLQSRKVK